MHRFSRALLITVGIFAAAAQASPIATVDAAMDQLVTRLLAEKTPQELAQLDDPTILKLLRPEERTALATRFVHFKVNVPVVVSILRESTQAFLPFWLKEDGFEKTALTVKNTENWTYEVWQKKFPAGEVGLGINGFDKHRPAYVVAVGPQETGQHVEITDRFPGEFSIGWLHDGAFTYHDWDSLLLKDVPDALVGQQMLTTIRGRAREAHLVGGGFRETATPSSTTPDQVMLTWSDDPRSTQAIQWRTSPAVVEGAVRVWAKATPAQKQTIPATHERVEDRFLLNDRYCHRFTVHLTGLQPDTDYAYEVGDPKADTWSAPRAFTTAPELGKPFTFITFGDTHKKPVWGKMLQDATQRHPEAKFYLIAGDLVDTGQYRDDWDLFFALSGDAFGNRPVIPTIGNHDAIDGLGAGMYRTMFALPENGPAHTPAEHAFTLRYGNVQFFILDSGLGAIDQAEWLEKELAASTADWKIAMFHFPPYSVDEGYPDIANLWGYLFDKYHLDLVLEGHVHYYMRSHPIRRGKPVENPADGTIHLVSIAIPNRAHDFPPAPYAAVQFGGTPLYQTFDIDGRRLTMRARDPEGKVRDEFTIQK